MRVKTAPSLSVEILEKDQYSYGFDSQTGEYGNLVAKGIIDPTKVVRVAIQNAASVAALLITTEAMVAEVPKKNAGGGMPAGGGMGGMDFRSNLHRQKKARRDAGLSALASVNLDGRKRRNMRAWDPGEPAAAPATRKSGPASSTKCGLSLSAS